MGDGPPCRDRPELNVTRHSGTKLPSAELLSDVSKTSNDLIHVGALRWVFMDHIGNKRLHELEAVVSLVRKSQKVLLNKNGTNESGPAYNLLEPSFLGNTHRWEMDYTGSSRPDVQVQTCHRHSAAGRVVARLQGHRTASGRSR